MDVWGDLVARVRGTQAPLLNIAKDVGEGPVVVMVHGIASSATTFKRVIPRLKDSHRCISLDLLGFGESPSPEGAKYTIEEHVAAIHATIRSLRLSGPFVLMGHSMGSLLAARYAAIYPQHVRQLLLVSPPVYMSPSEFSDQRTRTQVGAYLRVYEYMRSNKEFTMATASTIGRIFGVSDVLEVTERNWPAFMASLQNCIESQTTISDIAAVKVPVNVIYGAQDQFIAPGTLRIIEQMRHVTIRRVEVNDHLIRNRLAKAIVAAIG